jgi:hypothetical protein
MLGSEAECRCGNAAEATATCQAELSESGTPPLSPQLHSDHRSLIKTAHLYLD